MNSRGWANRIAVLTVTILGIICFSAEAGVQPSISLEPVYLNVLSDEDRIVLTCKTSSTVGIESSIYWLINGKKLDAINGSVNLNVHNLERASSGNGNELSNNAAKMATDANYGDDDDIMTTRLVLRGDQLISDDVTVCRCVLLYGRGRIMSNAARIRKIDLKKYIEKRGDVQLVNTTVLARNKAVIEGSARLIYGIGDDDTNSIGNLSVLAEGKGGLFLENPTELLKIIYYHNGSLIHNSDKYRISRHGSLHISNITWTDAGLYQCYIRKQRDGLEVVEKEQGSTVQQNELLISQTYLTVSTSASRSTARLTHKPRPLTMARAGGVVELECIGEGWPIPRVIWTRDGGLNLPMGRYRLVMGNLSIEDVKTEDAGTYTCSAENRRGHAVNSSTLLVVLDAPVVVNSSTEDVITVNIGDSLVLNCSSKGTLLPSFIWYHNAEPIINAHIEKQSSKTKSHSSEGSNVELSSLVVKDVTDKSSGVYQCIAENSVGIDHKTFHVLVVPIAVASSNHKISPQLDLSAGYLTEDETLQEQEQRSEAQNKDDTALSVHDDIELSSRDRKDIGRSIPSRPIISPGPTSSSLRVDWSVEQEVGGTNGSVTSFEVQWKAERQGFKSRWSTVVEDLTRTARFYVVHDIQQGTTYQFRITAVYEDGERKYGRSSRRFSLADDDYEIFDDFQPSLHHTDRPSLKANSSLDDDVDQSYYNDQKRPPLIVPNTGNELLFLVLGCVFGTMLLILISVMLTCALKQRKRERMLSAIEGRSKFHDAARTIHLSRVSGQLRPSSYTGTDSGRFLLSSIPCGEVEFNGKKPRPPSMIDPWESHPKAEPVVQEQQILLQQHHFQPQLHQSNLHQQNQGDLQQSSSLNLSEQQLCNLSQSEHQLQHSNSNPMKEFNQKMQKQNDSKQLQNSNANNTELLLQLQYSNGNNAKGLQQLKPKVKQAQGQCDTQLNDQQQQADQARLAKEEDITLPASHPNQLHLAHLSIPESGVLSHSKTEGALSPKDDFVSYRPPLNPPRPAPGSAATTPTLGVREGDTPPSYQKSSLSGRSQRSHPSRAGTERSSPGTTLSRALDLSPDHIPRMYECQQFYRSPDHSLRSRDRYNDNSLRSRDRSNGSRTMEGKARGGASGRSSELSLCSSPQFGAEPSLLKAQEGRGDVLEPLVSVSNVLQISENLNAAGAGSTLVSCSGTNIDLGTKDAIGAIVSSTGAKTKVSASLNDSISQVTSPSIHLPSNDQSEISQSELQTINQPINATLAPVSSSCDGIRDNLHSSGTKFAPCLTSLEDLEQESSCSNVVLRLDSPAIDFKFADEYSS